MKGEGGAAGEGRLGGERKFHSWGKCTTALTNMLSDWISVKYLIIHYMDIAFSSVHA